MKVKIQEQTFRSAVHLVNERDDFVRAYRGIMALDDPLRITGKNVSQTYGSKTVKLPEGLRDSILGTLFQDIRDREQQLSTEHNVFIRPFNPAGESA